MDEQANSTVELQQRVARLEAEVAALRASVARSADTLAGLPAAVASTENLLRTEPQAAAPQSPERAAASPVAVASMHVSHDISARGPNAVSSQPAARASLESRVGSQWFARIGIVALLLGVGLFFKLVYDSGWIHPSPMGKTIAGVVVGTAVVLWSERFRRRGYTAFSYSLKAVGTGVLYLTLWAAFHLYALLPAPIALVLMIAVTAWNTAMAVLQDAELLAVYALVGGFLTPGLLGTGGNHETFLFAYLAALDSGVLWLLVRRPWQRLLLGSFPATVSYFFAWYFDWFHVLPKPALETGFFVMLLASPFIAIALAGEEREGVVEGVLTPLGAAAFASLGLYCVLEDSGHHAWLPWMCVVLAAVYVVLARVRRAGLAPAMHTSIAIALLTIAIPLKASGHWLTVSWLVEGIALLWLAARGQDNAAAVRVRAVTRWLGITVLALGLGAVVLHSFDSAAAVIVNQRFLTELCGVVAAAAAAWLWSRQAEHDSRYIALGLVVIANLLLLWAGVREIDTFYNPGGGYRVDQYSLGHGLIVSAWLMIYSAALLVFGFVRRTATVRWQGLGLLVFTIAKVFLYDVRSLSAGYRILSFLALGALLMAVSFAYQRDLLKLHDEDAA